SGAARDDCQGGERGRLGGDALPIRFPARCAEEPLDETAERLRSLGVQGAKAPLGERSGEALLVLPVTVKVESVFAVEDERRAPRSVADERALRERFAPFGERGTGADDLVRFSDEWAIAEFREIRAHVTVASGPADERDCEKDRFPTLPGHSGKT